MYLNNKTIKKKKKSGTYELIWYLVRPLLTHRNVLSSCRHGRRWSRLYVRRHWFLLMVRYKWLGMLHVWWMIHASVFVRWIVVMAALIMGMTLLIRLLWLLVRGWHLQIFSWRLWMVWLYRVTTLGCNRRCSGRDSGGNRRSSSSLSGDVRKGGTKRSENDRPKKKEDRYKKNQKQFTQLTGSAWGVTGASETDDRLGEDGVGVWLMEPNWMGAEQKGHE